MRVLKSINNNVISALDEEQNEVILFGTGIGFRARRGDLVDEKKIQKAFFSEKKSGNSLSIRDIPVDILEITKDILNYGTDHFQLQFQNNVFFSLCDHLRFAIERLEEGIDLDNPFIYEIKSYYANEYKTALRGKKMIEEKIGLVISENEVCYIALHLIESNKNLSETVVENIKLIDDIMCMIETALDISEDDRGTFPYGRLLMHVKLFVCRYLQNEEIVLGEDSEMNEMLSKGFIEETRIIKTISEFLRENYGRAISQSECNYLIMHIVNTKAARRGNNM